MRRDRISKDLSLKSSEVNLKDIHVIKHHVHCVVCVCESMYVQVICIQEKDLEGYIVSFLVWGFVCLRICIF